MKFYLKFKSYTSAERKTQPNFLSIRQIIAKQPSASVKPVTNQGFRSLKIESVE